MSDAESTTSGSNGDPTAAADRAFDLQFSTLAVIGPPRNIETQTLAAWRAERKRTEFRTRLIAGIGMIAMAAMALLVVNDTPIVGTPESMVERGAAAASPAIGVKVSVRTPSGMVERFATNRRYDAGTTLMFRVSIPAPTLLTLRREQQVLWTGELPAGDHDLPVGYTLESGEGAARFLIEGGTEPATIYLPAVDSP